MKHGRPYYDEEHTKQMFDESSTFQSRQIESNAELRKKLKEDLAMRK